MAQSWDITEDAEDIDSLSLSEVGVPSDSAVMCCGTCTFSGDCFGGEKVASCIAAGLSVFAGGADAVPVLMEGVMLAVHSDLSAIKACSCSRLYSFSLSSFHPVACRLSLPEAIANL